MKIPCKNCSNVNEVTEVFQYFIDCITDGITIMGADGTILMLNQVSLDNCPYTREELIGKNMRDLIARGMFSEEETVCFQVAKTRKSYTIMQKNASLQCDLLVTGIPYWEEGRLTKVILTERDITELTHLKERAALEAGRQKRYEDEIAYYRAKNFVQEKMVFQSEVMGKLLNTIAKVAPLDVTVSIQGESGTGKSLLARLIYEHSSRSKGPFIEISCAAIPENLLESELFGYEKGAFTGALDRGKVGLFELASGGTLFLDEIGTMPLHLQTKLLRAIQTKQIMRVGGTYYLSVDVRIITATNVNLEEAVRAGTFRQDLFYRINVVPLVLPPLRNRKEDIRPLCEHFLSLLNKKYGRSLTFQASAWKLLYRYKWPGNIRELKNVVRRACVLAQGGWITLKEISLPVNVPPSNNYRLDMERTEQEAIQKALETTGNDRKAAARLLGISRSTLYLKLKKYGLI